jgi:hypothetical protein
MGQADEYESGNTVLGCLSLGMNGRPGQMSFRLGVVSQARMNGDPANKEDAELRSVKVGLHVQKIEITQEQSTPLSQNGNEIERD